MTTASVNSGEAHAYRSFEDLELYKAAREFRMAMYRVAKQLPDFLKALAWKFLKLTNGYLRCLRDQKFDAALELRETPPAYHADSDGDEPMEWLKQFLEEHPTINPELVDRRRSLI
ncbi:MAG TPA: hypothetical protein VFM25_02690 [Verrucomicrobiae bacterium]|jgi:hypothetical protein|nr:hypothetical protein [Verrucomicrobiae bacterium]